MLAPSAISHQVAASLKSNGVQLLSVSPCMHWTRISGDLVPHLKISYGCTMHISFQYFYMALRSVTSNLEKKMDALDIWCLKRILHNSLDGLLSPMTWFSLVRVSHASQILSVDSTCLSLATFVMPKPVKTILELFRPAFRVLPKTGNAKLVDRGKPG